MEITLLRETAASGGLVRFYSATSRVSPSRLFGTFITAVRGQQTPPLVPYPVQVRFPRDSLYVISMPDTPTV
mgnify:CR=1 FL=1